MDAGIGARDKETFRDPYMDIYGPINSLYGPRAGFRGLRAAREGFIDFTALIPYPSFDDTSSAARRTRHLHCPAVYGIVPASMLSKRPLVGSPVKYNSLIC